MQSTVKNVQKEHQWKIARILSACLRISQSVIERELGHLQDQHSSNQWQFASEQGAIFQEYQGG